MTKTTQEMPSHATQRERLLDIVYEFKGDLIQHRMCMVERIGDVLFLGIAIHGFTTFEIVAASHEEDKPYDIWEHEQDCNPSIYMNALTKAQVVAWITERRIKFASATNKNESIQ